MYAESLQSSRAAVILGSRRLLAAFLETGFKPIEFFRQIVLYITDAHSNDPVAARLQPRLPRGAVFRDCLGLVGIDQLNRDSVHEGDKIRNVPADRRLPLELPGEAAIRGQRLPQKAFR